VNTVRQMLHAKQVQVCFVRSQKIARNNINFVRLLYRFYHFKYF